jgi:type II secretory pathway component PulJ
MHLQEQKNCLVKTRNPDLSLWLEVELSDLYNAGRWKKNWRDSLGSFLYEKQNTNIQAEWQIAIELQNKFLTYR